MKNSFNFVIFTLFMTSVSQKTYAYLDPGTGSMIIQLLIGIVAATLFFIKQYWQLLKNFVKNLTKGLWKKSKKGSEDKIQH